MNELLFFIIGLFLGYLMGILVPCVTYVKKLEDEKKTTNKKLPN